MMSRSFFTPSGALIAWLRRMTRPSRLVMVPVSSAHWVTGSTTSASAAVSLITMSATTSRSSAARRSVTWEAFGAETTMLEPKTSRLLGPSGVPSASSSS